MKGRRRVVFLLALLLYLGSFFLPAIVLYEPDGRGGLREGAYPPSGYFCAIYSFEPLGQLLSGNTEEVHRRPVRFFAMLVSSLINPVFLITIILLARNPSNRVASILRIGLLLMLVCPVIVFFQSPREFRPATAYFLWTVTMPIALFCNTKLKPGPI